MLVENEKIIPSYASFEVFKAFKIQVEVFGIVTLCSNVLRYQYFGKPPG
jgi:hypothetical protein